jgi:hypothetical protein
MGKVLQQIDPVLEIRSSELLAITEGIKQETLAICNYAARESANVNAKLRQIYGDTQYVAGAASGTYGANLVRSIAGYDERLAAALTGLAGLIKPLLVFADIDTTPVQKLVTAYINGIQAAQSDGGEFLRAVVAEYSGDETRRVIDDLEMRIKRIGRPKRRDKLTRFIAEEILAIESKRDVRRNEAIRLLMDSLETQGDKCSPIEREALKALDRENVDRYVANIVSRYRRDISERHSRILKG